MRILRLSLYFVVLVVAFVVIIQPAWYLGLEVAHKIVGSNVEYKEIRVDNPFVRRNGELKISVRYQKSRDCPGFWAYTILWNGENTWMHILSGPAGVNPPGLYWYDHKVDIPADAPVGPAKWVEVLSFDCGSWTSVSRSPEVNFQVLE